MSDTDSDEEMKEEERWTAVHSRARCNPESVAAVTTESKTNGQLSHRMSDEVG